MVEHRCGRCGYTTNKASTLRTHLQKTKVCQPLVKDVSRDVLLASLTRVDEGCSCQGCSKKLATYVSLQRHQSKCVAYLAQELKDVQSQLHNALQVVLPNSPLPTPNVIAAPNITTQNNTHNNHSTNNITININAHGNEDLSHLTPEFFKACVQNGAAGLVKFIDKVHFDAAHPENKNVRLLSKKQQLLYKYEDGNWVQCDRNFTLDKMIDKNKGRLQRFIMTNEPLFGSGDEDDDAMLLHGYHNNYEVLKIGTRHFYALRREVYALVLKDDISECPET